MPLFQADTLRVERDNDGSVVVTLDVPGRSVNVITRGVLADLDAALDFLSREPRVPVVVVRSGKKTGFLAGADINEFTAIDDAGSARSLSAAGQDVFNKLAGLHAPSVAVIHGPCLGGGLELALACDYRLVFEKPGTQLGLPEVELGLIPGWGGTQRLPRTVGLERALQVILGGRRLSAGEAFRWGLADALATSEAELRTEYQKLLLRAAAQGKHSRDKLPLRTWRQRLLESNPFGRRLLFRGTERLLRGRVPDDMPAPGEALDAVRFGLERGTEAGLTREREAAGRLAVSPACRNLVRLFLAREAARKLPADLPEPRPVKRLGVVGAGVMGAGIAQLAALAGVEVVVQEVNQAALDAGLKRIGDLFAKAVERKRLTAEEAAQHQQAVRGTVAWEGFDGVDLVIEAAVEDLEVKRNLFREMAARTSAGAVLATNTSSLMVARLQEGMADPGRIGGMHFFNPVHKMPLVEVVQAPQTAPATTARLVRLATDLGKIPVRVGDGPGFVVNRILMPYLDEAVRLVGEGMKVKEIDPLMRRFGMPAGPLELLDQIGLDVAAHVARLMQEGGNATSHAVFERMRQEGFLGEKAGRGFYLHQKGKRTPHPAAAELVRSLAGHTPPAAPLPGAARLAEARERLVLSMVNEAAAVLEQGLADAGTVDLAMVFGTGWAPHRGGPLHYADSRGIAEVVGVLDGLAERRGPRFTPCGELRRRAGEGRPFFSGAEA